MTRVDFHFNVPDRLMYACRLLRKAYHQGAKLVVTGDSAMLQQLDQTLWTFEQLEFLPHCGANSSREILERTAIVLAIDVRTPPQPDVLINLGTGVPDGFERYQRLIEIVGRAEQDRLPARERWKHYSSRGYPIQKHEVPA